MLNLLQEQAQQYALTVVAMEEKLSNLMESHKALKTENETLKAQLTSTNIANMDDMKGRHMHQSQNCQYYKQKKFTYSSK